MANKKGKILSKYSLIKKYSNTKNTNIAMTIKEENLSFYLAGLIEGDGYISITNKNRVILGINFNIKDKPLAVKLLSFLGKGYIVKRETNSIELRFSGVSSLKKIIILINGKFRTPKIDQLYILIDWMNKNHLLCIPKLPVDNSPLNNNS
jgi:LAGLIDADG endonuclease